MEETGQVENKNFNENWPNVGILFSPSVLNLSLLAQNESLLLFYSSALHSPCWICSLLRQRLLSTESIFICPETLSAMSSMDSCSSWTLRTALLSLKSHTAGLYKQSADQM